MDIPKLVKSNQGLLTGTALLCLGAVVAGACGTNPVLGLITNVTAGLAGDNLSTLAKRWGKSGDVLRNQDLARATGQTIGWTLLEKISPDYPNIKKQLDKLANKIEDYWLAWEKQQESEENFNLFEGLHEDQLVQIFSQQPDQFTEYQVLESSEWQAVVRWLFEQGYQDKILKGDLAEYEQVMGALAGELELHFNQNLRSVLKDDAKNGGKAFAGMLLDLHGATIAKIENIQAYLPQLATREDICRLLQQLDSGIQDELSQIRQTLQQYVDLNQPRLPMPQYCEAIIADKTQDFVGRGFVFEAILNFLEQRPKGYFILEADPGVGKTAIMARLVQLLKGGCIAHFNGQAQGNKPKEFLENVCLQLIDAYQLNYSCLPAQATENGNILANLLGEAAKKLAPGKKLVIVVDALDEVEQSQLCNILYLPDCLEDKVYFILSKRPQQLRLPLSVDKITFDLMKYPAESGEDARRYAEKRYEQSLLIQEWVTSRQLTVDQFLTTLIKRSADPIKGVHNFMYLRYVLNDIEEGRYESDTLESLPEGLQEYYQQHWQRMGMVTKPLPRNKLRIIYLLSKARRPVSCDLLADFAKEDPVTVQEILDEWKDFLPWQEVNGEKVYSIYHKSFEDFLFNLEIVKKAGISLRDIELTIVDNLWNKMGT